LTVNIIFIPLFIAPRPLRVNNARFIAFLGGFTGVSNAYLASLQRLIGLLPNGATSGLTKEEAEAYYYAASENNRDLIGK
jgi:hypothetical protein